MRQRMKKRRGRKWKVETEKPAAPPVRKAQPKGKGAATPSQPAPRAALNPLEDLDGDMKDWIQQIRSGAMDQSVKVRGKTKADLAT